MTAYIVIGLGFGDEGKGTTVDALAKKYGAHTVVRFNGGAQAAHNVVHDNGTHHTFNQFGSATFRGVRTHMTRDCLFDPFSLKREAAILETKGIVYPLSLFTVHEQAIVVTPYHMFLNGMREMSRGANAHGSCGMGIGETMQQHINRPDLTLYAGDLVTAKEDVDGDVYPVDFSPKIQQLRKYVIAECHNLLANTTDTKCQEKMARKISKFLLDEEGDKVEKMMYDDLLTHPSNIEDSNFEDGLLLKDGNIILEGAQGVLLDENYGFHPHTTWSTTTFHNAQRFLNYYKGEVIKIGVTRAYATRHGAGPFPTFNEELTTALPDRENVTNRWQGGFRVGAFDLQLFEYAVTAAKPDFIAVTCLDRVDEKVIINEYASYGLWRAEKETEAQALARTIWLGKEHLITPRKIRRDDLAPWLARLCNVKVAMTSYGPKADDKEFLFK